MPDRVRAIPGGNVSRTEAGLIAAIEALWRGRGNPAVALAGGDDCAVLRVPGSREDLLVTSDQIVENKHFDPGRHPAASLGRKALVRSLSDIAAMGGRPAFLMQTICMPKWVAGSWHDEFQAGMRQAAELPGAEELALVGGDISAGDAFVATTTVIGTVEAGAALTRSGARPGDSVHVSGALGGSGLGLSRLLGEPAPAMDDAAVRRHCEPFPRLELGRELREIPASSAIDLSDGLAIDANRLADASGSAFVIDPALVPLFPGAQVDQALRSGEEYELLFTLPPAARVPAAIRTARIGRVEAGSGAWLETGQGRVPLPAEGFSHF